MTLTSICWLHLSLSYTCSGTYLISARWVSGSGRSVSKTGKKKKRTKIFATEVDSLSIEFSYLPLQLVNLYLPLQLVIWFLNPKYNAAKRHRSTLYCLSAETDPNPTHSTPLSEWARKRSRELLNLVKRWCRSNIIDSIVFPKSFTWMWFFWNPKEYQCSPSTMYVYNIEVSTSAFKLLSSPLTGYTAGSYTKLGGI